MKSIKSIIILHFLVSISLFAIAQETANVAKPKQKNYGKSFFEKDSVHVIKINFVQCNYWDSLVLYRKMFDSLQVSNYMQSTVTIDNHSYHSVGIRFKGESSYEFYPGKKKPFRLKFNKFIKGQNMDGLEELNLNNNFKDPTMIREKIYLDMLNKEGLPAPRATYAKVYINDNTGGYILLQTTLIRYFYNHALEIHAEIFSRANRWRLLNTTEMSNPSITTNTF